MTHPPSHAAPNAGASPQRPGAAAPALVPSIAARRASGAGHALAVQGMFDRISPTYDLLNRVMSLGVDQRWRRRALTTLLAQLPPGPILDLCAGTGDLARALTRRAPDRPLLAADFARRMLLSGRQAGAFDRPDRTPVGLAQADAMRLPFADGAFAGAICGFAVRNLTDPLANLAEVHRVLRPGGVFVVLEFYRPTRAVTRAFHAVYGRVLLPAVGALISGDATAYRYLSNSMLGFMTRDAYTAAMTEAGFSRVRARDLTLGIASLVWGVK